MWCRARAAGAGTAPHGSSRGQRPSLCMYSRTAATKEVKDRRGRAVGSSRTAKVTLSTHAHLGRMSRSQPTRRRADLATAAVKTMGHFRATCQETWKSVTMDKQRSGHGASLRTRLRATMTRSGGAGPGRRSETATRWRGSRRQSDRVSQRPNGKSCVGARRYYGWWATGTTWTTGHTARSGDATTTMRGSERS